MKILLVNAINKKHPRDLVLKPLGLAYVASYIRENGNFEDIKIINGLQETIQNLKLKPDIVAISSVTQNYNIALRIAETIKSNDDIPVIVGGHHITALPNNLSKNMDVAVLGEGEQTMLELIQAFENKGLPKSSLSKINGIAYHDGSNLVTTKQRNQINPLDEIPFPARDLLDIKPNELYLFTSRGCPARCPYCSSSHFWKTVRFHSPEYVVAEIKELIEKYHPKGIMIYDDLFIADRIRFRKIIDLIETEGINKQIGFSVQARVNFIDDESCQLLKRMNASVICGFESGSPKILRYLKNLDIKKNWNAVNNFEKYGIQFSGSFMIGIPNETSEDMDMTLQFIKQNNFSGAEGYVLTPFPGTAVWNYAKSKDIVNDDMNWDLLNIDFGNNWKKAIIVMDTISREELYERYILLRDECEKKSLEGKSLFQIIHERGILKVLQKGITNPYRAISFIKNAL